MTISERITALSSHLGSLLKIVNTSLDKKANKENWFTLCTGFLSSENLAPIATGKVKKYTYPGGGIRYRYIATDGSEDSFYMNYSNGVFTNLVATRKITL